MLTGGFSRFGFWPARFLQGRPPAQASSGTPVKPVGGWLLGSLAFPPTIEKSSAFCELFGLP